MSPSRHFGRQSIYLPLAMVEEALEEARRLDRPLSWIFHRVWKIARAEIKQLPATPDVKEPL